jgi:hypothetical protein
MSNIKIFLHILPQEIDHFALVAEKLKQSIYHISPDDKIYIDTCLNLSEYIFNWSISDIDSIFFIKKYETICKYLEKDFIHKPKIQLGKVKYGHLDLQRDAIEPHIDYYISICPDIAFSETLLHYLIESAKQIKNEYFVITPQIYKCWDSSWDELVHPLFKNVPHEECLSQDIQDIQYQVTNIGDGERSIKPMNNFKYAGWFDLYNKNFYERLCPPRKEWSGYGPYDLYSMNIANLARGYKKDVQQYLLKNEVIWFSDTGRLRDKIEYGGDGALKTLYTQFLNIRVDRYSQRVDIDKNIDQYMKEWYENNI